ncbi:MerR family transcriptional regulator [Veillonella magna]|uniref:MerR family transcriptional regulator n=1 Tax=Veillonella magna TaxID=464322 RepID=A0ABS2GH99_9FIRM|nr:MerR family transcriptional regulator [Veillonella magna]MBM6824225.1 MerR family transcriptional regulator [Veillonella magna]MBM6912518.1 MerR family transcriptional regulator [Veillonella magna]
MPGKYGIPISEMAKLHGLQRSTLLYYDSIGLFKPVFTDDNGYRYYSHQQIPVLREICFLKSLGVGLKEIELHIKSRDPLREMELLRQQAKQLEELKRGIERKQLALQQRLYIYTEAVSAAGKESSEPFLRTYQDRRIIFAPFSMNDDGVLRREDIHLSFMTLWREMYAYEFMPAYSFGTIYKKEQLSTDQPLLGAGSYLRIPNDGGHFEGRDRIIPAGRYACYYKIGTPDDTTHLKKLLQWVADEGHTVIGDAVDTCFLDSTFGDPEEGKAFSMVQVPVEMK